MNKKKLIALAVSIGVIGLIVWIVASGLVKPASQSAQPAPVATESLPPAPTEGLVEDALGAGVADGPAYVPTVTDIKAWLPPLIAFDTTTQTYDQWHEYADANIVYTPQDFPKDSVLGITPSAAEWGDGWKRTFDPFEVIPLDSFKGQGGATVYTWVVGGDQMLYGPDGEPWIGSYTEVNLTAQCAGSAPETCRVLSFDAEYPLTFEREKALYTP